MTPAPPATIFASIACSVAAPAPPAPRDHAAAPPRNDRSAQAADHAAAVSGAHAAGDAAHGHLAALRRRCRHRARAPPPALAPPAPARRCAARAREQGRRARRGRREARRDRRRLRSRDHRASRSPARLDELGEFRARSTGTEQRLQEAIAAADELAHQLERERTERGAMAVQFDERQRRVRARAVPVERGVLRDRGAARLRSSRRSSSRSAPPSRPPRPP